MKETREQFSDRILKCEHEFEEEDDEEGGVVRWCKKCEQSDKWIKQYEEDAKNKRLTDYHKS